MNAPHRRTLKPTANSLRIRSVNGQPETITGYAAAFYREGDLATEFRHKQVVERIRPGAFDAALEAKDDIAGLLEHDMTALLGRRSSGTLAIDVDEYGLRFSIPIDHADPDHQRAVAKIQRGDVRGASFGFADPKETWESSGRDHIRWLDSIPLVEVSITGFPAYGGTSSQVRSAECADLEAALLNVKIGELQKKQAIARKIAVEAAGL